MDADCSASSIVRLTNNSTTDNEPAWSPDGTQIAYSSFGTGNAEIFITNSDGTGTPTNLTNNPAQDISADWSPDGTQIAFTSNRAGNSEIFATNADGSGVPTNLTNNAGPDASPSYSPDGTQIAFSSSRTGDGEIFTMDADGSNQTNRTNIAGGDDGPSWSPDGTQIAFRSTRSGSFIWVMNANGSSQTMLPSGDNASGADWQPISGIVFQTDRGINSHKIYLMNIDGSNPTDILNDSTATSTDLQPSWSSDGTRIAFAANRSTGVGLGPHDAWTMNADGSNLTQLTFGGQFGLETAWSPDDSKIAYVVTTSPNQIRVINTDSTGQTQLTSSASGGSFSPTWSPDGSQIMFSTSRDGNSEIYIMDSNGASQTPVFTNPASDIHPNWCSVGNQIAFASDRFGDYEIFVMNADGTGQTRLTTATGTDFQPSWSDDCSQIAFTSNRDGNSEIYVMNADGTNQVNITNNSASDSAPDWFSPVVSVSPPTEQTISIEKDSFLKSGKPNTNEGANPRLRVRSSGKNRAVMAFDLTGVNVGSVTSATLVLTIAENANNWGQNDDRTVDAHPLIDTFTEGDGKIAEVTPQSERTRGSGPGVTWNCATDDEISNQSPNCILQWGGGNFGTATASPVIHLNGLTGEVSWDVTADVIAGTEEWLVKKTNELILDCASGPAAKTELLGPST